MRGDLDCAVEAIEDFGGIFALPAGPVMEHHAGRGGATPATVIAQDGPEVAGLRLTLPRIQHRGGRLIDVKPRAVHYQPLGHVVHHGGDKGTGPAHPVSQHGPVYRHPMPRHHHGLAVQRHVFGVLGHGNLGQQRLGRPTALQQMRGRFRLHHARPALGAGVFRADRDDHLIARRDVIQPLSPVFADPDHVAAVAGAGNAVRLDHALDPRQAFGQGTGLAGRPQHAFPGVRFAGRDPLLEGRDLCLRLGDGGLLVLQRQFQLCRVQLLGFRPELGAPIVQNLTFQLLDQRLQLGDEGILFGHHRLLMLARRTLERGLELRCCQCGLLGGEGLHNLWWKVRELAEIEGLRHALSYPIRDRKPNKTTPKSPR